jgi:hypothetical protein
MIEREGSIDRHKNSLMAWSEQILRL